MDSPIISVITPASRGADTYRTLLRDFRNQTFKSFEHIVIYDGDPPEEVSELMDEQGGDHTVFCHIEKDQGNMSIAPGTKPRNYGITMARGQYLVFCDDDDRYKDQFLEKLITGIQPGLINIVQMSCQESRMYKNGNPDRIKLIPEIGLPYFPIICHVGTPCFIVPKEWAVEEPWREEPEHDFRFIKRICERFKPQIRIIGGMQVDVDGLVLKGMKDWVSLPPYFRE